MALRGAVGLLAVCLWLAGTPNLSAGVGEVTLEWDPSTETNLLAYRVYYGFFPDTYTNFYEVEADTLTVTIDKLVPGVLYYFAATAVDDLGMESAYSNEVAQQAPGDPVLPPSVEQIAPGVGATYNAPVSIFFAASVMPNGHTVQRVHFMNGDDVIGELDQEPYVMVWEHVPPGTYSVRTRVIYDNDVWTDSESVVITVNDPQRALNVKLSEFLNTVFYSSAPWPASIGGALQSLEGETLPLAGIFATLSLAKWAAVDPLDAAQWAAQLPLGYGRSESIQTVAYSWGQVDLERALTWLAQLPDPDKEDIKKSVLQALVASGDKALDPVASGIGREQLFMELITEWSAVDPGGVSAYLNVLQSSGGSPANSVFKTANPFVR